jgi:hypothetical protein
LTASHSTILLPAGPVMSAMVLPRANLQRFSADISFKGTHAKK